MSEFDIDTMPPAIWAMSQSDAWDIFQASDLLTAKATMGLLQGSMASYNFINTTAGPLQGNFLTCGCPSILQSFNAAPGAQQLPSAAVLWAGIPGAPTSGASVYLFRILNTGAGTLTLTQDVGATTTMIGTMTVPGNTWRDFLLYFQTPTVANVRSIGAGTA